MTEIRLKHMAWDLLETTTQPITAKERQLANGVLTYFDPSFFCKGREAQVKSLRLSDSRREELNQESERGYKKWMDVKKRKAAAQEKKR